MILYEYEGKKLLSEAGIQVPKSQLVTSLSDPINLNFPLVLKAQVLSGKRAKVGGIIVCENKDDLEDKIKGLLGKSINQEKVDKVLVEEKIEFEKEYYLSISYNSENRSPILTISGQGGTGVEERIAHTIEINPLDLKIDITQIKQFGLSKELINKLIKLFLDQDCLLLEINPLAQSKNGDWIALDAKVKLDDTALGRHEEWQFSPRSVPGYQPTEREIEAKKIDQGDHRGTAGSTYFDLDGDIAILASGGGGSLTAMDALLKLGGKPANYTEYSGNPPKEKVEKLTSVVLSKPNLNGLWVVGAIANLTDIYETLLGFIEGLRNVRQNLGIKIDFPIVIRRAGPRDEEAFEMLRKVTDFDLHLYGTDTSITQSGKIIADLTAKYASKREDK